MTVSIDAAAMVCVAPGMAWTSRYHMGEAGRVLALTHAATVGRTRREEPAELMDAFLQPIENRGAVPLSDAVEVACKDAHALAWSVADPLARTSLAALVFDESHVAITRIGNSRVFVVRAGGITSLDAERTVEPISPEDVFVLCTASVWTSVSPASLARAVGRGRTAARALATIRAFMPEGARLAAIVARVVGVAESLTGRCDELSAPNRQRAGGL